MFEHCLLSEVGLHHTDMGKALRGVGGCGAVRGSVVLQGCCWGRRLVATRHTRPNLCAYAFIIIIVRTFSWPVDCISQKTPCQIHYQRKDFYITLKLLKAHFGIMLRCKFATFSSILLKFYQWKFILIHLTVFYWHYWKRYVRKKSLFDINAFRGEGNFV